MPDDPPLDAYRPYLRVLARLHLHPALHGHLDASDVVQHTLLHAHQAWHAFAGSSPGQRIAWLRQILAHVQANLVRDLHRDKRDVSRDLRLALDQSSARLDALLPAPDTSPSQKAIAGEQTLRLAAALDALPADQRDAVTRHYLLNQPLSQVGDAMGRSTAAVAGLLQRGLRRLRELMPAD